MHNDTSASPQPRIDIVTDHASNPVGGFLRRNLETVLDGFVDVANYYLDTPTPEGPSGDVVMVMTREKAVQIRQAVADPKRIVIVNRTIPRNLIYRILSIPLGTRVLVVNDSTETTLDFISLLYRLGVDHLDLVPFDPRIDYPDVSIAITPGELIFVPAHIENVIDTGNRSIDISTFIQVLDMVNVSDPEVHRRLLRYSANLVPLESGVDNQYRQLYLRNLEMDSILNVSHEGILLIDPSGSVAICNKALLSMLELRSSPLGKPVGALADEPLASLLARERFDDELVQYRNHSFLVTATVIEQFGKPSGTYFNFRDVTYIRRLEQNLNRRMLASGFLPQYRFDDIQTVSPAMNDCVALARKYAGSDLPVSISGESGTGKELLAHAIHRASRRHNQPFVAFNCAAMPESLLESELFGYETGAFTGALKGGKAGLFEQADTGTIFLDEIGDMPYSLQAKLLRVLQEQQVMRIGSQRIISIDVRVISATNQDLETRIADGLFRGDLYYRLNVLPLAVPPLRNRPEDILHLLSRFLEEAAPGKHTISEEASRALTDYPWPGNIRELRNAASYISFAADGPVGLAQLPPYLHRARADCTELERTLSSRGSLELARAVLDALQRHHRVAPEASGLGRAALARELGSRGLSASEGMIRGVLSLLN
ncbi:MAG: sigma 54-interacting transcriptional regulator, partial [Spirochaetales bacterium]|nr:sigma 54-interacting transcriptional regulator [Spirochaetales bacterium]